MIPPDDSAKPTPPTPISTIGGAVPPAITVTAGGVTGRMVEPAVGYVDVASMIGLNVGRILEACDRRLGTLRDLEATVKRNAAGRAAIVDARVAELEATLTAIAGEVGYDITLGQAPPAAEALPGLEA